MTAHAWVRNDSLSSLAAEHGLESWRRIWTDPANAALRASRGAPENLRPGDVIQIPDARRGEVPRASDIRHSFVRVGVPPASIRFISDGGNPRTNAPAELTVVQVSTLVTTTQLPPGFLTASNDPRNFKVEIYDEGAAGNINAVIEVLKPVLDIVDQTPSRNLEGELTYLPFNPARTLNIQLRPVPGIAHTFRSRYLRLVTDAQDRASRPQQAVLVDHDPNELPVEILDQRIQARYTATSGEALAANGEVGDNELRVRVKVYLMRTAFGAATLVGGVTAADVRRHVLVWVRRTYAAANLAPKLLGVDVVDPLENMIWIRGIDRRDAVGGQVVRFRVNTAPPTTISLTTVAGESANALAARLAAEAVRLLPGNYLVDVFDNPVGGGGQKSADILIREIADAHVIIDNALSNDGRIRAIVGRMRPGGVPIPSIGLLLAGSPEHRVMARNYRTPGTEDTLGVFIIGRFLASAGAVGLAYPRSAGLPATNQAAFPTQGSCYVEARTTAPVDHRVHTMDHEMGHILIDMGHFAGHATELMSDAPVNLVNSVNDSKRLSDVGIFISVPILGIPPSHFNPNQRIRSQEPGFIETWDTALNP